MILEDRGFHFILKLNLIYYTAVIEYVALSWSISRSSYIA